MCIIKRGNLKPEEFNLRCHEVFVSSDNDEYFSIVITETNEVIIAMEEYDERFHTRLVFNYKPDMSKRPEALAYLLGETNKFHD